MSLPELERIYGYNTLVAPKGLMTAFRVSAEDLERIDAEAKRFRMTRSEYIIRACLHELPVDDEALQAIYIRLERLERCKLALERLERVEERNSFVRR